MTLFEVPNPPPNPRPTQKHAAQPPAQPSAQPPAQPRPTPRPTVGAQPPPPKGGGYKASRPKARGSSLSVLSDEIAALAGRVRRLSVSHRHPERFHEEKSEIEHLLRGLSQAINLKATKG